MSTRVALVTGANKGIGLAIVRGICKQFNGDVILTSRDPERGATAIKQLEGEGLKVKFHQLDVDSRDSISALKEFVKKTYNGIPYKEYCVYGKICQVMLATFLTICHLKFAHYLLKGLPSFKFSFCTISTFISAFSLYRY